MIASIVLMFSIKSNAQIVKAEIRATGLTCSMCSNAINKQLKSMPEVINVETDLNTNTFTVELERSSEQMNTLEIKRLPAISEDDVRAAFGRDDLLVFTEKENLENFLMSQNWFQSNLLMMSSGTFGGIDLNLMAQNVLNKEIVEEFPQVKVISKEKQDNSWGGLLSSFKKAFGSE